MFMAGNEFALLLKNPQAIAARAGVSGGVRYPLVLAVVARHSRMPLFMVTLEQGPFDTTCLCSFGQGGQHSNHGTAQQDEITFVARARQILKQELDVTLHEVPPPPPGYVPKKEQSAYEGTENKGQTEFGRFLKEMDESMPPHLRNDPTIARMHTLMKAVAVHISSGGGSDEEAALLERELQWASTQFPPDECAAMRTGVRAASPRYRHRIAKLMELTPTT